MSNSMYDKNNTAGCGYEKLERYNPKTLEQLAYHYKQIIRLLGEDTEREGLLATPVRVAKAMQFFTQGYDSDPEAILRSAVFKEDYRQMVLVKDIEIYSLCEHHMVPMVGKAHVAYIPNGKIVGLSKIPRVVDCFARRLQVQERMTQQIKEPESFGRGRCNRGKTFVYEHERRSKTELTYNHIRFYWRFPKEQGNKRGIHASYRRKAFMNIANPDISC